MSSAQNFTQSPKTLKTLIRKLECTDLCGLVTCFRRIYANKKMILHAHSSGLCPVNQCKVINVEVKPWSYCGDMQIDLGFHCAHMSYRS